MQQNIKNFRLLPFESVSIKVGFNIRQDYGDIQALAESIAENGIKSPLRGYAKGATFIITDGHRRYTALKMLREQGRGMKIQIPFLLEEAGYTEEKRTFDLILLNDGKKLTIMEEAQLYKRIKDQFNLSNVEIAKKAGKSSMHVGNCLLLLDAPTELQQHITNEVVSASLIIEKLRAGENGEIILEDVNTAIESHVESGSKTPAKVSKKHLTGVKTEKAKAPKVKVEDAKTDVTSFPVEVSLLKSLIDELGGFDDMSSRAATNTLKFLMEFGKGEITKDVLITKMFNNLID